MKIMSENMEIFEAIGYPRAGSTTANVIRNTMKNTSLGRMELFLRESVQNSFDARDNKQKPVEITFNGYSFTQEQSTYLMKMLGETEGKHFIKDKGISIPKNCFNIEVCDSNTSGLSGPYKFEYGKQTKEEKKFLTYVYMTGNDDNKLQTSGGSYGFGKGALYLMSESRMLAVYTRVKKDIVINGKEVYESRFIMSCTDERLKGDVFRCWWGKKEEYPEEVGGGSYATPLLDKEANEFALSIGMTPFLPNETGTHVLIINAKEEETVEKEITENFQEKLPVLLTHWFWPKMVIESGKIDFKIFFNKEDISDYIPNPRTTYPYSSFTRALREYHNVIVSHGKQSGIIQNYSIRFGNPEIKLGDIFLGTDVKDTYEFNNIIEWDLSNPIVATMRNVEFIVQYKSVPIQNATTEAACFGIFHTNLDESIARVGGTPREVENYFRKIETPTHDQWIHNADAGKHDYAKKVEQTIPEKVKEYLGVQNEFIDTGTISALVARKIGRKLAFGIGFGASENNKEIIEKAPSKPKETYFRKSAKEPEIEQIDINGVPTKVVTVYCECSVEKGKTLEVDVFPYIKMIDPAPGDKKVEDIENLYITEMNWDMGTVFQHKGKNGAESRNAVSGKMRRGIPQYTKIKMPQKFNTEDSGLIALKVIAKRDCAFDLSIDPREV